MSRTEDVRGKGKERGGSGSGSSGGFVKWGDTYTWLEGRVTGTFTTKYGLAATLDVTRVSENGLQSQGRDEDGNMQTEPVKAGMAVALSTSPSALQGKITDADVGKSFHVAFEGWGEGKTSGNRFRVFAVIELTEREPAAVPSSDGEPEPQDTSDYSQEADDGLPF